MLKRVSCRSYLGDFPNSPNPESPRKEALKQALENRKFEIELYWKRAAYFWAFIAAAFTGFFLLEEKGNLPLTYTLACLGFMFSLGWYFVNRGSKAWQQNWEMHVDLLEDDVNGPLYKTVVSPRLYRLFVPTEAYPFSVSKINQILSLFVTAVWLVLVARTIVIAWRSSQQHWSWTIFGITLLTIVGVIMLCRATSDLTEKPVEIVVKRRTYVE